MKGALLIFLFFAAAMDARAEIHALGVDISRRSDEAVRVSLVSEVPNESRKDISVEEAAKIIRSLKGCDSTVFGIMVRGVAGPYEYLPILRAIAESGGDIAFLDGTTVDYMNDNIRKRILSAR